MVDEESNQGLVKRILTISHLLYILHRLCLAYFKLSEWTDYFFKTLRPYTTSDTSGDSHTINPSESLHQNHLG